MAQKINRGTSLNKKLLPEISPEIHKKVSDFLKFKENIPIKERASVTLWVTNLSFILYEHVELHKGMGGYTRENSIDLGYLRDYMNTPLEDGSPFSSIIFLVLSNCFNADMHKRSNNYDRFIHPQVMEKPLSYPGGPNNRWNKHIYH